MKARQSYLRSMTDTLTGSTQPVLRAPSVPVWPARPLGAEFFNEAIPRAELLPQRTRVSDTLESQTTLRNPVEPRASAMVESRPLRQAASAASGKTTSTLKAARMHREGQEQLLPLSTIPSQIDFARLEDRTQQNTQKPGRSKIQASARRELEHTVSTAQPEMPDSAATSSVNLDASDTEGTPEFAHPQPRYKSASVFLSSPENSDRSNREEPVRTDAATDLYSQIEPAPAADGPSARQVPKTLAQSSGFSEQREAEKPNSVHIGKIDIHIAPPPEPTAPRRAMRSTPANSSAALARGFLSSFGLRQG
jgi:hypothetical protein